MIGLLSRFSSGKPPVLLRAVLWFTVVAAGAGYVALITPAASQKPVPSGDDRDVILPSGPVVYRIPWQYLPGATSYNPEKGTSAFHIFLFLPDFKPAALDRAELSRVGWHKQLSALFEHGRPNVDPQGMVRVVLGNDRIEERDHNRLANGCDAYPANLYYHKDLYICHIEGKEGDILVAACDREQDFPRPSCQIAENITEHLSVDYSFSRDYVELVPKIGEHMRKLARSFIVVSTENQP